MSATPPVLPPVCAQPAAPADPAARRPRRAPVRFAAALRAAGAACAAGAAPLTHHGFSSAGWSAVKVGSPFGGGTVSAAAGAFSVTWGDRSFLTYCLELTQYAAIGQTHEYTLVDGATYFDSLVPGLASRGGSGAVIVERIDRLFTALGGAMVPGAEHLGVRHYDAAAATAAMQLAIWELVYEGFGGGARLDGMTLAGGAFSELNAGRLRSAGLLAGHADTLLRGAAHTGAGQFDIAVLHSPRFQDYLVISPRVMRDGTVPVPGTLALAALGLLAAAGIQRGRRSSASPAAPISANSARLQNS
jgi:hypothetical protein